jgi:hypothetical protein
VGAEQRFKRWQSAGTFGAAAAAAFCRIELKFSAFSAFVQCQSWPVSVSLWRQRLAVPLASVSISASSSALLGVGNSCRQRRPLRRVSVALNFNAASSWLEVSVFLFRVLLSSLWLVLH